MPKVTWEELLSRQRELLGRTLFAYNLNNPEGKKIYQTGTVTHVDVMGDLLLRTGYEDCIVPKSATISEGVMGVIFEWPGRRVMVLPR